MFLAVIVIGLCLIAWYVAFGNRHSPFRHWNPHWTLGHTVLVLLLTAVFVYGMMTTKNSFAVFFDSIMAFLLGAPLIYTLVLLTQIPLVVLGLIPFSEHAYFVTSAFGALVGTFILLVHNFSDMAAEAAVLHDVHHVHKMFRDGMSPIFACAFGVAVAAPMHGYRAAAVWIIVGTIVGILAVAATFAFIVLGIAEDKSASENLTNLAILLLWALPGALSNGISGHSWQSLEVALAAEIVVAFGLGGTALRRAFSSHRASDDG